MTIATPDAFVFEGDVHSLILPGSEGYLEILAHHAPLCCSLKPGEIAWVSREQKSHRLLCRSSGLFYISNNRALLLPNEL